MASGGILVLSARTSHAGNLPASWTGTGWTGGESLVSKTGTVKDPHQIKLPIVTYFFQQPR